MYRSLQEAVRDADAQKKTLAQLALETESRDQGRPVEEIRSALRRALEVMRGAIAQGLTGDLRSASGLVGGDAAKLHTGAAGPLANTPFRDILARALAVQEVNAAMGVIVAAPTAGGAGVLPAVLTGLADARRLNGRRSRVRKVAVRRKPELRRRWPPVLPRRCSVERRPKSCTPWR